MGLRKLEAIKSQIEANKSDASARIAVLQTEASKVFEKMMSTKKRQAIIAGMVSQVEASKELTQIENDEWFAQWARADLSSLIDTKDAFQRGLLEAYFEANHYVRIDFANDCLTYSIGPAMLINHEGDVLDQDSGKWVISKRDYETKEQLYSQIEAHMEKTGHFPSVLKCDYYGNASYVDTQSEEQKIANKKLMEAQNETH